MKTIVKVRKSFEWEGITIRLATVSSPYLYAPEPIEILMAIAPNNGVIKNEFPRKCTLKRAEELTIKYLNNGISMSKGLNTATVKRLLTEDIDKDHIAYCHENK